MLAILAAGDVRLTLPDGSKVLAQAEDGFLSVDNDTITIVARKAELVGSK
jgi:F-type H+-transporting ATPase subunit epsilon